MMEQIKNHLIEFPRWVRLYLAMMFAASSAENHCNFLLMFVALCCYWHSMPYKPKRGDEE